jgi:hypothetical protein
VLTVHTLKYKIRSDARGFVAVKNFRINVVTLDRVFLTQDGPRKKLKIFPEPPGNELSEYVFF